MNARASITVLRPRDELERLWHDPSFRTEHLHGDGIAVRFVDAPGDRGTEIHVDLGRRAPSNVLSDAVQKLRGTEPVARAKDELRRFKQLVETGEVARSDGVPGGEALGAKLSQRPAQPTPDVELQEAS